MSELREVSTAALERLVHSIELGELDGPLRAASLRAAGHGALVAALRPLLGLEPQQLRVALAWVLAERERAAAQQPPELVFTRAQTSSSQARDTAAVFSELCDQARQRVFIAGYSFTAGHEVLAPLHRAMAERGVAARIVLDCSHWEPRDPVAPDEVLARAVAEFWRANWQEFGEPRPQLFYDPLTCTREFSRYEGRYKSRHSMHAKCVIIDDTQALVGSANFSRRATRDNIEVGVVVRDPGFVRRLIGQWADAINERVIVAVEG